MSGTLQSPPENERFAVRIWFTHKGVRLWDDIGPMDRWRTSAGATAPTGSTSSAR